jgi:1,4-dihydroxy-6-naphthoate synthase
MKYARGLEQKTADTFVGMYVNRRTVDMGEEGKRSIRLFLERGVTAGVVPAIGEIDFVS